MNKKSLLAIALTFALSACDSGTSNQSSTPPNTPKPPSVSAENQDQAFAAFASNFIEQFWQFNPGYGVYVGFYKYDDSLPIPNTETAAKYLTFAKEQLTKLNAFSVEQLTPSHASDLYILKNQLESDIFYNEKFGSHQWDPSEYNVAGVFGVILNTDYKAKDERLKTIFKRMANIPAYYQAAMANITKPTIPHTELAIQQNQGALGLFEGAVAKAVTESGLTEQEKQEFATRLAETQAAISGYIDYLNTTLNELNTSGTAKDFRIGEALYQEKFALDIFSGYTANELYQKALAEKDRVQSEMIKLTEQLWPKYFADSTMPEDKVVAIKQLIDHISVKHVERDKFVDSIREQIPELEKFVLEHNLIEMDESKPLVVRETPEYQRGFAGASINAPGPYDADANTYYNVTPLDHYNEEQAESYLREYNHWLLQILNIHEAVPGHYTQLVHSNKTPSMVKAIFGNGAMIEGWAVYAERVMLEEGYGNFEPELWLMYYKWNLRVIMNSIIDYEIQVKGIDEQRTLDLMMNQAFQEEAEARGKWKRATLSQVQLTSYFTGYAEIYALREELKEKTGDKFNLTDFHNQLLSYGSAPVPIIRKLMFDDYIANHQ